MIRHRNEACVKADIGAARLLCPADRGKGPFSKLSPVMQDPLCKVAVVSTYVPKNCGLATFTHALMQELRVSKGLPQVCKMFWDMRMTML